LKVSHLKLAVKYLQSLDMETVALLPTIIAIQFATELTSDEQETLGNFLIDIGDTLFTTSSLISIKDTEQKENTQSKQANKIQLQHIDQEKMKQQINDLQIQNQQMINTMQELQKMLKTILSDQKK